MGKSLPKSLPDFQRIFPNEEACYTYLYAARFPNGFICPYCNRSGNTYRFQNRPDMLRCNRKQETLEPFVQKNVKPGTEVRTDGWGGYENLGKLGHKHKVVLIKGEHANADTLKILMG